MKTATVGVLTQEGFLTGLVVKLDSGLILRTHAEEGRNLAWVTLEEKSEMISQFNQFLDQLTADGWKILGSDVLDEYR